MVDLDTPKELILKWGVLSANDVLHLIKGDHENDKSQVFQHAIFFNYVTYLYDFVDDVVKKISHFEVRLNYI